MTGCQFSKIDNFTVALLHFQTLGAPFFITYSLAGSLPVDLIIKLQKEYEKEKLNLMKVAEKQ
jgi:hypothetical protein